MSRRIDIELTSLRDDQTWTWRAIGAREPKGVIDATLVPAKASVGDELRVEADFFIEGIEITMVLPAKGPRKEPELLEILGSGRDTGGGVTTTLVSKRGRGSGGRGDGDRGRSGGGGRGRPNNRKRDGGRDDRPKERRPSRDGQSRRPERPEPPRRPKPKRLRAQRKHRSEALAALPEEQRPIAEQVLRGGVPAVRKAVEEQNTRNSADGLPQINPTPLLDLAETMLPGLKQAEWHDRADAALAAIDELDLRDLRSVVVAAESNARSEETRALADELRQAVSGRVDQEHNTWLGEIAEALTDDRTVRALRMSSRPPKAGAPLPPDLSSRLSQAAAAALSSDTGPQRWGTVLDAVAFSPVRSQVVPAGIPTRPNDELLETVKRLSTRVPEIAALFGIEPQKARRRRSKSRGRGRGSSERPTPPPPPKSTKKAASDAVEATGSEPETSETTEDAVADNPVVEKPEVEPAVDDAVAEEAVVEEPAEEAAADDAVVEEAVVEEPAVEEPVAEEAVVEEPAVEEPVAEEAVVDESVADQPADEESAGEAQK